MMITMTFAFILGALGLSFTQSPTPAVDVALCDLFQHPEEYLGRMVRVRATVAGSDLSIDAVDRQACPSWMPVIVVFPKDVKPSPGFDVVRDAALKQFDDALYGRRPVNTQATFEGQFHSVIVVRDGKRIRVGEGYGKKRDYDARIVLYKVSEVMARPLPRR